MIATLPLAGIPAQDEALRLPVRLFLDRALADLPAPVRARSWFGFDAGFSRQLAEHGWLGLTLPREYGGHGRGFFARFVVAEELLAVGAPVSAHWIADRQSGPLIARYGSEAQKRFYLPKICRAEAFFCIGMSEPNAGSDLASVGSRAEPTATGWKLNGRKVWTTNAQHCHYMIALVRSSGVPADRHAGLSQFVIDLSLPGVTVRPIRDLTGDEHFSEVFFDDVQLDADALIGAEGAGWEQVTAELAFERSGPERLYSSIVLLDEWLAHLRRCGRNDAGHAALLGRFVTHLAVLREMSIAVTARLAAGDSPIVEAALVKDLGTGFEQALPALIADALGSDVEAPASATLQNTLSYLTQIAPAFSLRGGTREILRGIIAKGLDLR
jgi:alkylation response protein AidB-like acyl-CoA dehydrogenase